MNNILMIVLRSKKVKIFMHVCYTYTYMQRIFTFYVSALRKNYMIAILV